MPMTSCTSSINLLAWSSQSKFFIFLSHGNFSKHLYRTLILDQLKAFLVFDCQCTYEPQSVNIDLRLPLTDDRFLLPLNNNNHSGGHPKVETKLICTFGFTQIHFTKALLVGGFDFSRLILQLLIAAWVV